MKYTKEELNKLAADAKEEYWKNAYKNKLKDIYHLEVALKWLTSPDGIQIVGLEKATHGELKSERELKELQEEIKFLEKLML